MTLPEMRLALYLLVTLLLNGLTIATIALEGGWAAAFLTHDGNHLRNTARTHPAIPGDDVAMALDYRTDPADPRVVASDFWTDPKRCSWQAVTPSFSQLVEVLRLV